MSYTGEKTKTYIEQLSLLFLSMERGKDGVTNLCTNILSESERAYEYSRNCNGNFNKQNELTDNYDNNQCIHYDIISSQEIKNNDIDLKERTNPKSDIIEELTISDVPTDITHNSSSYKDNEDDWSIDTVSTLGGEPLMNDSPRRIFPRYWDGSDPNKLQKTMLPSLSSYSHGNGEPPSQHYDFSKRSRSSSFSSDKEDYEAALRGYEGTATTIPRSSRQFDLSKTSRSNSFNSDKERIASREYEKTDTALSRIDAHHDRSNITTIAKKSVIYENFNKIGRSHSTRDERLHKVLDESTSQSYYNDPLPKVCSTPALNSMHKCPQRSCMRPRSLSTSEGGSECHARVTFGSDVSIIKYSQSHKLNAGDGWSKWFV
jgi:hypothetical protein